MWCSNYVRGERLGDEIPLELKNLKPKEQLTVIGTVFQKEEKSKYQVLYISYSSIKSKKTKIIIHDKSNQKIAIGNKIKIAGEFQLFQKESNPGNFNQKFYYQKQGISGILFAEKITVLKKKTEVLGERLYQIRIKWKNIFIKVLGEEKAGVMAAILLGEKNTMDTELKELYQKNGIGHIMAISGLHIFFVGMGCYKLLRKVGISTVLSGIIGLTVLILYALMVGLSVSTIRAVVMFAIRIGGDCLGRVYDMMTALFVAAIIILIWRPLSLYDASFLLSFGAVLGILILNKWILWLCASKKKWVEALAGSLSISIMIFPILIYFYFEFPLYSFLLNLLVVPLVSWILGAGIIGSGLYCCKIIVSTWILKSCGIVIDFYTLLCEGANQLWGTRIVFGKPQLWQIMVYYIVIFFLFGIAQVRKEKLIWKKCYRTLVVTGIIFAMFLSSLGHGKKGELEIVMIDVGQGDGIFMRGPSGTTYLIDSGSSDVKNVGKYRIEPFLKAQGVSVLDYVFVSHGDADHINGIDEMLQRQNYGIRIKCIVLPIEKIQDEALKRLKKVALENKVQVITFASGQFIKETKKENSMVIKCIQPDSSYANEIGNASSMVLHVSYKEFDMLLTGDVENSGEQRYIVEAKEEEYEVLKVAHHGSKNSSSKEFLIKTKPHIALISAGKNNSYGHPHKETVKRLEEIGAEIYNSSYCGAVKIITDGKEKLRLYRYL